MRLPNVLFKMILGSLTLAALTACSAGSDSASSMIDAAGKHVVGAGYTNWVQQHWVEYKSANGDSAYASSTTKCSQCHGIDLTGGTSKVSCFSQSFAGMECHPNGVNDPFGHPKSWADPTGVQFHGNASYNNATVKGNKNLGQPTSCGLCHQVDAAGRNVSTAPTCFSGDSNLTWNIRCHFSSPTSDAAVANGCLSCHNVASTTGPDGNAPVGNVTPNLPGVHSTHLALPGVTCGACHFGGGHGTANHSIAKNLGTAFVNISSGYAPETGRNSYANGSCSAVSCHGGLATLSWRTTQPGTLDVERSCDSCHRIWTSKQPFAIQYNSYSSGKVGAGSSRNYSNLHDFHINSPSILAQCWDCHNTVVLDTQHFNKLATHRFENAPPALTIGSIDFNNVNNTTKVDRASYQASGSCGTTAGACHAGGTHSWR